MSPASSAARGERLLALDLGTSSVRALVMSADGTPTDVEPARHKVEPDYTDDGAATLDLDDYLGGLGHCLDTLQAAGHLAGVGDVVLSTQWHSIVALDNHQRPTTPLIPWTDTRSIGARTSAGFDQEAFHHRTGAWLHRLYWTRRIPWLVSELGHERAASFVGLPELVLQLLTGEPTSSASVMSGTGMLELHTGRYDDEALEISGVGADRLPAIAGHAETFELQRSAADRWPDLTDAVVHPPAGDGAASNVGSGAEDPRTAAVTIGTSAAVRVTHPIEGAPELPWGLWRYRVDDQRAVTGMAFSAGGNLHAWLSSLLSLHHDEPTDPPGSGRVIGIPFQAGTRPPKNIPTASGVFFGLSFETRATDLLAAALEGAALEIDRGLMDLDDLFGRELDVIVGGGSVHASGWLRGCLAGAFGRGVTVYADPEVGCRGAAAIALGLHPEPGGDRIEPDPDTTRRLDTLKPIYEKLRVLAVEAGDIDTRTRRAALGGTTADSR